MPINPGYGGSEIAYHLKDSGAKLLFAWHELSDAAEEAAKEADNECEVILVAPDEFESQLKDAETLDEVAERDGEDLAVLMYTSGTTGEPKGSALTHANLSEATRMIISVFDVTEDDVILGALPLFHVFGQVCGLGAAIKLGACLSMIPKFEPEKVLEVVGRDGVTILEGVPTMYGALVSVDDLDAYDISSVRLAVTGGQAMPQDTQERFEDLFEIEMSEGFGLSETASVATMNKPGERRAGSIGKPVEGVELKTVDDDRNDLDRGEKGELAIKGPTVMTCYWNKPEETDEDLRDGWFHTGDVAEEDDDGFFYIVDRKKDMIIRGGENIYPREVEEVLFRHDAIEEAAVVGIEDDKLGEEIGAAVVLKEGEDVSTEDIQEYAKGELASVKYPRRIWFVDELPKGPTGKVQKKDIEVPEE